MKKKLPIIVFIAAIVLCACGKKQEDNSLNFPKTTWEMGMDEVMSAWGAKKEDTKHFKSDDLGSMFTLEGQELFGEQTELINFQFYDFAGGGTQEFCYVQVTYPDDADMDQVLTEMKKAYGEPHEGITFYIPYMILEELKEFQPEDPDKIKSWALDRVSDLIDKEKLADYQKPWEAFQQGIDQDHWDTFINNTWTVRVSWITDAEWNRLEFDATGMKIYHTIHNQLNMQE